jgi:hypothetical protein
VKNQVCDHGATVGSLHLTDDLSSLQNASQILAHDGDQPWLAFLRLLGLQLDYVLVYEGPLQRLDLPTAHPGDVGKQKKVR